MARSRRFRLAVIVLVLLIAVVGWLAWYHLFREVRTVYASDLEHFKYGSVGVEAASGAPYWIWRVLPRVCADKLPRGDGYGAFGFVWEEGQEAPIGLPVKTVGFRRIGINCALCHTGTVRTSAASQRQVYVGAPSTTVDLQGYLRFLFACAESPRFTPRVILSEVRRVTRLNPIEHGLYRFLVIPQMRKTLLAQKAQLAWMDRNPDWGPGRQDPFNPAKTQILRLPADGTIGNADIPPLWNWMPRSRVALHWDGLNTSLVEVFLNSGIGNGASAKTIDTASLDRMQAWVQQRPPARYPFTVDSGLLPHGRGLFESHCASCHAFTGAMVGQPIRLEQVGTDRHRLDSWSPATAAAFNALDEYRWRYRHFRGTHGYVAVPLDGVWARAPYLHNGSVPSLRDLLEPPASRPSVFHRGYDVYDPVRVGFVAQGAEAEKAGFRFDTRLPGNGNGGHLWGTELSADDKRALIEYLKTL